MIKFLRGDEHIISISEQIAGEGQPVYNLTNGYLYVGDGKTPIKDLEAIKASYADSFGSLPNDLVIKYSNGGLGTNNFIYPGGLLVAPSNSEDSVHSIEMGSIGQILYINSDNSVDWINQSDLKVGLANGLTTSGGSVSVPIYFENGKPSACKSPLDVDITGSAASASTANTANNADSLGGIDSSQYALKSDIPTVADPIYYYTAFPYINIFQPSVSSANDIHVMLNVMSARDFNFIITSATTLNTRLTMYNNLTNFSDEGLLPKNIKSFQGFVHRFTQRSSLGVVTGYLYKAEGNVAYSDGTFGYISGEIGSSVGVGTNSSSLFIADIGGNMTYLTSYGELSSPQVNAGYLMGYGSVDRDRPSW